MSAGDFNYNGLAASGLLLNTTANFVGYQDYKGCQLQLSTTPMKSQLSDVETLAIDALRTREWGDDRITWALCISRLTGKPVAETVATFEEMSRLILKRDAKKVEDEKDD